MIECTRKNIFGRPACRFEGRYDVVAVPMYGPADEHLVRPFYGFDRNDRTYVRDVCVKCGRTIERQPKESA